VAGAREHVRLREAVVGFDHVLDVDVAALVIAALARRRPSLTVGPATSARSAPRVVSLV
jgi:hypothetical protein